MAVQRTFQAVVTVLDRTAAPLRAIQARLAQIAATPAFQRMAASARNVAASFVNLAQRVAVIGSAAAAAGVALGLAFGRMGQASVESAGQLADLATRTGVSVERLQELRFAASQVGVQSDALTAALERLQKGSAEVAAGRNANLTELFRRLGVSVRDSSGQIRGAADLLPELADAFAKVENPALRTRMAMALFGRGGAPLISLLQGGADGLEEQARRWRELGGGVLNSETVPALDDLGDRMDQVRAAVTNVRDAIVVRLAPALTPLLEQLGTWIGQNQQLVAQRVADWVMRIATTIEGWDLPAFLDRMERWGTAVAALVEKLGGLEGALIAFGLVLVSPQIAAIVGLVASFARWAALLVPGGGLILGLAALGGAAATLYSNWAPFRDLVDGVVAKLQEMVGLRDRLNQPGPTGLPQLPRGPDARPPGEALPGLTAPPVLPIPGAPGVGSDLRRNELLAPRDAPRRGEPSGPGGAAGDPAVRRQSFAPGAPAGEIDIRVRFDDLPRGARVDVTRGGAAPEPRVDVGYAMMGAA